MTRKEAEARCDALNNDEQGELRWFAARAGVDEWEVVSVAVSGLPRRGPVKETVESQRRLPDPADPRPLIPPYIGPAA